MAVAPTNSLTVAVAHAITFLIRPLISSYPPTTIIKLQLVLEANLTALYAPTWVPKDPLRNSGRRCLTLSPEGLPPRPIYSACVAASIQWFDWMAKLGGVEFDFFVDPGCISIRYGKKDSPDSRMITIWADEIQSPAPTTPKASFQTSFQRPVFSKPGKTLAQQLIEEDVEEEDQLFAMIANEVSAPAWMTPVLDQFPHASLRTSSPLSTISSHSRCSSRSSNSSSQFSHDTSNASMSSSLTVPQPREMKQSRRERARQARVYIDTSKTDVTPYDGGKTTVLTGGVMLGGAPKAKKAQSKPHGTTSLANSWRPVRI